MKENNIIKEILFNPDAEHGGIPCMEENDTTELFNIATGQRDVSWVNTQYTRKVLIPYKELLEGKEHEDISGCQSSDNNRY